jgi:hypothetical protein
MKVKAIFYGFVVSVMLLASCEEEQIANRSLSDSYLVFGTFAGLCQHNCVNYYLLDMQERMLYRLKSQENPSTGKDLDLLNAERMQLPGKDFQLAKRLADTLPNQIIEESDATIGCPDCLDQGGIYLSFSESGVIYEFLLDTRKEAIPTYLQNYADDLKNVLREISPE